MAMTIKGGYDIFLTGFHPALKIFNPIRAWKLFHVCLSIHRVSRFTQGASKKLVERLVLSLDSPEPVEGPK